MAAVAINSMAKETSGNLVISAKKWFNEKMSINDIKNTFRLNQKIPISYYDNNFIHYTNT